MSSINNINQHQHPEILYKFPIILKIIFFWYRIIYQRVACVKKELNHLINKDESIKHVIDAGCGEGLFLYPLAKRFPKVQFTGLDFRQANIELCQKVVEKEGLNNVDLQLFDLEKGRSQVVEKADLIFLVGVLHCINDTEAVLGNLKNILNEQGKLLIYSPINRKRFFPWFEGLYQKNSNYELENAQHLFNEKYLIKLLTNEGFEVKNIISINFLTVNESENIMHGQADPNDGKFLFMWFLKDSRLYPKDFT